MTSPTQRTLALLRAEGWTVAVCERWIQRAMKRVDVFGFGDILAIKAGMPVTLVQTTSGTHHADHKAKILAEPRAALWLAVGGEILLVTWSKRGERGKRKLWTARVEKILGDEHGEDTEASSVGGV